MIHRPLLLAALAACTTVPSSGNPPAMVGKSTSPSPNPASPSFAAIANRPGLSETSLGDWLADAHNYTSALRC